MKRSFWIAAAVTAAAVSLGSGAVVAQTYPSKPITIIVPFPAGGSSDIQTRAFAEAFSRAMGQPVLVDNRGGASGNIGTEATVKAAPDGYTLLVGGSNVINNEHLYKTVPYDWRTDLTPLGLMFSNPNVVIVNDKLPVNTIGDFTELLKKEPGKYNYGSTGAGGSTHLGTVLYMNMTGTDMAHIPYKGDAMAQTDLLSGEIHVIFNGIAPSLENIRAGNFRALATTGPERSPKLPDVPTLQESGLDGYVVTSWQGLFGPAGLSDEVVAKITEGFNAVYKDEAALAQFDRIGTQPYPTSPEDHATFMAAQSAVWTPIFKELNLTQQ